MARNLPVVFILVLILHIFQVDAAGPGWTSVRDATIANKAKLLDLDAKLTTVIANTDRMKEYLELGSQRLFQIEEQLERIEQKMNKKAARRNQQLRLGNN